MKILKSQLKRVIREELKKYRSVMTHSGTDIGLEIKNLSDQGFKPTTVKISENDPNVITYIELKKSIDKDAHIVINHDGKLCTITLVSKRDNASFKASASTMKAAKQKLLSNIFEYTNNLTSMINQNLNWESKTMKITKSQLKQIIKEELQKVQEAESGKRPPLYDDEIGGMPDPEYYEYDGLDPKSGYRSYRLKPEWAREFGYNIEFPKAAFKAPDTKVRYFAPDEKKPEYLDDYYTVPDPKYYEYDGLDPKSGVGTYKLRSKYKEYSVPSDKPIKKIKR